MSFSFSINKSRQTLEQQLLYLEERWVDDHKQELRKFLIALSVITALYLLFYNLTAVNSFITVKVLGMFLIAIGWCTLLVLYALFHLDKRRSNKRLRRFVEGTSEEELCYVVQVDEDKVTIALGESSYELPWTEFSSFGIYKETIYVYNNVQAINSLFWDRNEMGNEAYASLVDLLRVKSLKQNF